MKKELKFNNVMDVLEGYVESAENEFCKFLTFMGDVYKRQVKKQNVIP